MRSRERASERAWEACTDRARLARSRAALLCCRCTAAVPQSDAEFADTFARSKWRQSKWGPRRIELVRPPPSLLPCCCGLFLFFTRPPAVRPPQLSSAPAHALPSPLPQELHHRGVASELAAAALRGVFGEGFGMQQHLEQLEDEQERPPLALAGACMRRRRACMP